MAPRRAWVSLALLLTIALVLLPELRIAARAIAAGPAAAEATARAPNAAYVFDIVATYTLSQPQLLGAPAGQQRQVQGLFQLFTETFPASNDPTTQNNGVNPFEAALSWNTLLATPLGQWPADSLKFMSNDYLEQAFPSFDLVYIGAQNGVYTIQQDPRFGFFHPRRPVNGFTGWTVFNNQTSWLGGLCTSIVVCQALGPQLFGLGFTPNTFNPSPSYSIDTGYMQFWLRPIGNQTVMQGRFAFVGKAFTNLTLGDAQVVGNFAGYLR